MEGSLFSSHLLQLFGRQGSPGSIASAIPLDNTMIRAVLSDGEDRGSGSTAQVASHSGIFRVEEKEEEEGEPRISDTGAVSLRTALFL